MKSDRTPKSKPDLADELEPEYDFDFANATPNRFAELLQGEIRVVALDPDVAAVFPTTESVNSALRGLMAPTAKPSAS